jgi:hypothetical protein
MANHVRQQLRDAVATALTGLTTTGSRVFKSAVYPVQQNQCPALRIYVTSESVELLTIHAPSMQDRNVTVNVEACVADAATADDLIDTISKEVEMAIDGGITIGSQPIEIDYTGIEIDWDSGDMPIGVGRMTFNAVVRTLSNAPDVAI